MFFKFALPLFGLSLLSTPVMAVTALPDEQQLVEFAQKTLPTGTSASWILQQDDVTAGHQPERLVNPASTQKLLTALAARLQLGDDFRYITRFEVREQVGQVHLAIRFRGDPTLTRRDIRQQIQLMKQAGINQIDSIYLDDSWFDGYNWSNGQSWNDQGVCFAAPVSAIMLNSNCVYGHLKREPERRYASVFIPNYEPLNISSEVELLSGPEIRESHCALEMQRFDGNRYHLFGCVQQGKNVLPLKFAVNDPTLYTQQVIIRELNSTGIRFTGQFPMRDQHNDWRLLSQHVSAPLDDFLNRMLKKSDNLIADSLFKTIGAEYYAEQKLPGSYRTGAAAMRELFKKEGIDLGNARIADGSGLSRHNLMSAEQLLDVMEYVYQNDEKLHLMEHLPVSGVDGTMRYKRGLQGKEFRGQIKAKTGSLRAVHHLVGIIEQPDGKEPVRFALLVDGYSPTQAQMAQTRRMPAESPLARFYRQWFSTMVQ